MHWYDEKFDADRYWGLKGLKAKVAHWPGQIPFIHIFGLSLLLFFVVFDSSRNVFSFITLFFCRYKLPLWNRGASKAPVVQEQAKNVPSNPCKAKLTKRSSWINFCSTVPNWNQNCEHSTVFYSVMILLISAAILVVFSLGVSLQCISFSTLYEHFFCNSDIELIGNDA